MATTKLFYFAYDDKNLHSVCALQMYCCTELIFGL